MLSRLVGHIRGLVGRRKHLAEADEELRFHLEQEEASNLARGMSAAEARRAARRDLGGLAQTQESVWNVRTPIYAQQVVQDVRYALRGMRRDAAFTIATVLMLTLGVGLAVGGLGFVNGLFLRGWPVPDNKKVFRVEAQLPPSEGRIDDGVSLAAYQYVAANARGADYVAYDGFSESVGADRDERRSGPVPRGLFVSENFFQALRIPLQMGRAPLPEAQSSTPTVVISHQAWHTIFTGDPQILGRKIWVDRRPAIVVGVTSPEFTGLDLPLTVFAPLWAAMQLDPRGAVANPDTCCVGVAARVRPGTSRAAMASELNTLVGQHRTSVGKTPLSLDLPNTPTPTAYLRRGNIAEVLALVAAGALAVLVLTCANVGNLHLARGLRRRHEIATRLALGASRARIVRQLLTEGFVLAAIAGVLAYGAAAGVPMVLRTMAGEDIPRSLFGLDWRVGLGTSATVLIVCAMVSLAPALRVTHLVWRGGTATSRTGGLRGALLAVQVTIATVLILSALLIARGIQFGVSAPSDFALTSTTAASLEWPPDARPSGAQLKTFRRDLQAALDASALPIGVATTAPVSARAGFSTAVREPDAKVEFAARVFAVNSAAAGVLNIRMKVGRWASDDRNAHEGVVNETLARQVWGNQSPVGRKLRLDFDSTVYTIVGVVADAHIVSPGAIPAIIHVPPHDGLSVVLLTTASPAAESSIRSLLKGIAPSVSVRFVPLTASIRETMRQAVGGAIIAGSMGLVALILAMTGVYGVFSYVAEERRREIAIRLALGARRSQIRRTLFAATYNALVAGLAGGLALSLLAGMLLRRFLFGMPSVDPISYAAVGMCLVSAALLATYVPIRRALRCDLGTTLKVN